MFGLVSSVLAGERDTRFTPSKEPRRYPRRFGR